MQEKINIVIADSQYIAREGLKTVLRSQPDFKVLAEIPEMEQLSSWLQKHDPDIIIIDYNSPGHYAPQDLAAIKKLKPAAKILVISSDPNRDNIFQVLDSGIKNFLTKACKKDEIIGALYATLKGEKFFCSRVVDLILEKHLHPKDTTAATQLSQREKEVLQHIANGLSNKLIADRMNLSYHTITTHRRNIFKKLGINSVSEAVVNAIKLGII